MPLPDLLQQHRERILVAAASHKASNVRVFGSTARGEAGPDSDVDLLVSFSRTASLLDDHAALVVELEDILGCRVDVVDEEGLRPELRSEILAQAEPL